MRLFDMSAKAKYDWQSVDWSKSNRDIASQLNAPYETVASKRYRLKVGRGETAKRSDHEKQAQRLRSPEMRAIVKRNQPIATEAAKLSKKSGRGTDNVHAVKWNLTSPKGVTYRARNLYEFVRNNTHLFLPNDVIWKRRGGKRSTGGESCNVTAGLLNIKGGKTKAWKGWTLGVTKVEKDE